LSALLGVLPDVEVAVKAGLSSQAVAAERRRRGIGPARPRRKPIEWTDEMIELLGTDSDNAVAARLGVGRGSVAYKRHQLGIPPANPPPHEKATGHRWRPEELALLGKISDSELARFVGLTPSSISRKRQRLGIAPLQPTQPIEWTPPMLERLGQVPDAQLAREVGISTTSCSLKRQDLGIPAARESRPVERSEEVAEILHLPTAEVVHRTGLERMTIKRLRRDLGVPEPPATAFGPVPDDTAEEGGARSSQAAAAARKESLPPGWRSNNRWRPEELALLGTAPDAEIAARIGRTAMAVEIKRRQAGIVFLRVRRWQPHEIGILGTAPDRVVAARLGRTWRGVVNKRCDLGIPRFSGSRASAKALDKDRRGCPAHLEVSRPSCPRGRKG
jgi:hypothetical protein